MKKEYDLSKLKRIPRKHVAAPDATIPISVRMPLDVKAWLEKQGEQLGMGYQSAMLFILRQLMGGAVLNESRIREIVEEEYEKRRLALSKDLGAGERSPYAPQFPTAKKK